MNREQLALILIVAAFTIVNGVLIATGTLAPDWDGFSIIVGAGVTLALYSFLYRDNPLFKLAEHLYVGVVAAYEFAQVWFQNIVTDIIDPLLGRAQNPEPAWSTIIPTIFGILLLSRLVGNAVWLSRLAFGLIVGLGAGLLIPRRVADRHRMAAR